MVGTQFLQNLFELSDVCLGIGDVTGEAFVLLVQLADVVSELFFQIVHALLQEVVGLFRVSVVISGSFEICSQGFDHLQGNWVGVFVDIEKRSGVYAGGS